MAEIEGEYCPNESSPEYQLVLRLVGGDRQDAYEVWNMYKGELPNTLELQKVRYDYEVARRLRVGTLNDAVEEIRRRGKGIFTTNKHDNGIFVKDGHPNIGVVTRAIATVNRLIRKETFKLGKAKKRHKSGAEIRFLETLDGQSMFPKVTKNYQKATENGQIASEKTIRDLAARMSDRIGVPVKFESDRTKDYKGKIENNVAYVNLAHAALDTPIHEILGHPIIRAIKNRKQFDGSIEEYNDFMADYWDKHPEKSRDEVEKYVEDNFKPKIVSSQLYQNLLKELETGRGKEVLDRIKRDYVYKNPISFDTTEIKNGEPTPTKEYSKILDYTEKEGFFDDFPFSMGGFTQEKIFNIEGETYKTTIHKDGSSSISKLPKYTLEEQQEEAIVELLGLMTAEKLDKVKDGKLISLLKRLLKEMKSFVRQLLRQKEVEIDKLPDNMTLGDIADLLAYSNSKLILPRYEVIYTTPDNQRFKTYQEASNHISKLSKINENIDINNINITPKKLPKNFKFKGKIVNHINYHAGSEGEFLPDENEWEPPTPATGTIIYEDGTREDFYQENIPSFILEYTNSKNLELKSFIQKNKEYEQSKEIIEEWKKVNNIKYNPEEIYSRGQEFSSVVGAYSSFDVNLMMQNLLSHIEDNEKAGGKFAISAYTKSSDKRIGHLEGGGGKIKFKIYPKSEDILWAANTDVYSGSVWDASEKVSKDKKSELLGVSYTKYPVLGSINAVQPNLASIVDNLAHHHNELGIVLTGNNFRLEYDEDIPYSTKKIINGINSILDQKYGKLVKPEIKETRNFEGLAVNYKGDDSFKTIKSYEDDIFRLYDISNGKETIKGLKANEFNFIDKVTKGIQPTKTKENTTSISMVMGTMNIGKIAGTPNFIDVEITKEEYESNITNKTEDEFRGLAKDIEPYKEHAVFKGQQYRYFDKEGNAYFKDVNDFSYKKRILKKEKEYTSQALINTKIAKLKEVAKKYPRSLIRSEVKKRDVFNEDLGFNDIDDLPFQKVSQDYLPPDPKIEARVKEIMADLGIKLEAFDEYAEWYENTYGKPLNAVGVADMFRNVIAINEGRADKYTSLEELSHFITFALKDDKKVVEALSLVESTEEWKNFSEAYIEEYEGDMEAVRMEILGKIMKQHLGEAILNEKPIWKQRLDRIWKAFLQFFKFGNKAKQLRIERTLDKIINDVLNKDTTEIRENIAKGGKGVFQQIDPTLFENSKILDKHEKQLYDTLSIIKQKIKIAEVNGLENFTEKEKALFDKLYASYTKGKITTGLIDFIEVAETEANGIVKRLPKIEKLYEESLSPSDINKFGSLLRDMSGYISSYSEIVDSLLSDTKRQRQKLQEGDDIVPFDELIAALQNISSGIITMQDTYREYSKKILVERFRPLLARRFSTEKELNTAIEELIGLTEKTSRDISWFRKMFDSSAESTDPIIMMMDKLLKVELENSNLETEEILRDLIDLEENLRKEGLTNDIVVERDAEGIPTGNFVTERNEAAFEKDLLAFFTDLRTKFSLTQDPEIDNINVRITKLEEWRDAVESGSKKPFLAEDSGVQVTNSSEYFGEHLKRSKKGSKERTVEYLNNQINYLKKKGVNAYTKKEAHYQRLKDRSQWEPMRQHDYDVKIAKWISAHMEMNPEWEKLLSKKVDSVYNKVFLFDKDIQFVNKFKKEHGEFWLKELQKVNKELYNKAVEAETIIGHYKNERMVDNNGSISFRKNFAKPKLSMYANPQYKTIMSNPAAKAYYEGIMKIRESLTAHMGESYANSILLPQIRKDSVERLKTDPLNTIVESAKDTVLRRKGDTDYGLLDESGRPIDQVPLMFFNKLENSEEISTDVTASMIMFADMANRHKHINNLIDIAEIGRDVMRERTVIKKNVNYREFQIEEKEAEGGNAFERYEAMLKMNFYGQMKKDEGEVLGLDVGRVADAFNRYTSLNSLALNVYAGFSNIILGNILVRTEAFTNEFVDNKDVLYADKKYWGDISGLLADVGKTKSNNKLRLFMEKTDALQDFENRVRDVNTARSRWGRMFNMSSFFFINHAGEHQMQGRMAVALAHRKKVLNKDGKEIPMYEAFEVENGRLNIVAGTKNLDGSEFTNNDIANFNIRMKAINQRLHGIYNNTDKSAIQQYALGRMVNLFRKWMKPAANRRFDKRYYNYSLEEEVEGSYVTVFNFFKNLKDEIQNGKVLFASAKENFDKLSPLEKANMRRAMLEVATLLGAVFAAVALDMLAEGLDDDDDEAAKWAVNMTAYQANRLVTEIGVFFPLTLPSEIQKVIKSPMASINTLDHLLSLGKTVDPVAFFTEDDDLFTKYKSGRNKGDLRIGVWTKKAIPFVDTVEDWWYPEDRLKFFTQ